MFTDSLFARPSYLEGAARILDIGGMLDDYNEAATPAEADALAIWSDVCAVAADMRLVARRFKRRTRLGRQRDGQTAPAR